MQTFLRRILIMRMVNDVKNFKKSHAETMSYYDESHTGKHISKLFTISRFWKPADVLPPRRSHKWIIPFLSAPKTICYIQRPHYKTALRKLPSHATKYEQCFYVERKHVKNVFHISPNGSSGNLTKNNASRLEKEKEP